VAGLAGLPGHDACAQRPERRSTACAPSRAALVHPHPLPLDPTAAGLAKAIHTRALPRAPARGGGGVGVASVARVLGEHARGGCADNRCSCLGRCACASGGQRRRRGWAVCTAVCTTRTATGSTAASAAHRAAGAAAAAAAAVAAAADAAAAAATAAAAAAAATTPTAAAAASTAAATTTATATATATAATAAASNANGDAGKPTAARFNNGSSLRNHAITICGGVRTLGPRYISNHIIKPKGCICVQLTQMLL
jgi:hypothetical protein